MVDRLYRLVQALGYLQRLRTQRRVEQVVNEKRGRLQGLPQIVNGGRQELPSLRILIFVYGFNRADAPPRDRKFEKQGRQAHP